MAELNYNVNPNEMEDSFEAVPAGEYLVVIESSDFIDTKAGTGKILKLTYQILDGRFKGQKIFENLNLQNPNKQAEQISRKALNSIGIAVGVPSIQDSAQLHNIPLKLNVTVQDTDDYGKQNRIKKHMAVNLSEPAKPQEAAQGAQAWGDAKPISNTPDSQMPPAPAQRAWEKK